jgi:DNA invertase Pin-like site-specific DNA recombinase
MYLRQSQDRDGDQDAITRQREDCLRLCQHRWPDATITEYVDNNVSASSRSVARPAYRQMIKDIKAGLIDGIVAWDADRLYRLPRELEDLIDLADDRQLSLATVGGEFDLSTPTGRGNARMKGVFARMEMEQKSARQKRAYQQSAEAGEWQATYRPFGYDWDGTPLEPEATAVRNAYVMVLEGKSLRLIAKRWNEAGYRTPGHGKHKDRLWTNKQVRRTLLKPRYKAKVVHTTTGMVNGKRVPVTKTYDGAWTPLVDEATWNGVEGTLRDASRAICTTFEIAHQGSGVYRCGRCAAGWTDEDGVYHEPDGDVRMSTHYTQRKGKAGVHCYSCSKHHHLSRRGETLDDWVSNAVLERLAKERLRLANPKRVDLTALHNERAALAETYDGLAALYREGVLDGPGVRRESAELKAKIDAIDSRLAAAARTSPASTLLASGSLLRQRWREMSPALRGQVIDEVAVVTVLPCPRGLRCFNPDYVAIEWKDEASA